MSIRDRLLLRYNKVLILIEVLDENTRVLGREIEALIDEHDEFNKEVQELIKTDRD